MQQLYTPCYVIRISNLQLRKSELIMLQLGSLSKISVFELQLRKAGWVKLLQV